MFAIISSSDETATTECKVQLSDDIEQSDYQHRQLCLSGLPNRLRAAEDDTAKMNGRSGWPQRIAYFGTAVCLGPGAMLQLRGVRWCPVLGERPRRARSCHSDIEGRSEAARVADLGE
jgi:hypothetical protein